MMALRTPILSVIIGEGGSGGALALAVADEVWMLENSIYSIISPEGCAGILWRDEKKAKDASEWLKLTATDLLELKIIDKIIPESGALADSLRTQLTVAAQKHLALPQDALTERRYQRFRAIGG
jgi:acetyl-CoA carboxylase carboxyl transferase subunit alpha